MILATSDEITRLRVLVTTLGPTPLAWALAERAARIEVERWRRQSWATSS